MLTHNRPKLFNRALNSVVEAMHGRSYEILVNNDSQDIEKIFSDNIVYFNEQREDISELYEMLFVHSRGRHICFVEDDDYLIPTRFHNLRLSHDIHFLEYMSIPLISQHGAREESITSRLNRNCETITCPVQFYNTFNSRYFQLNQIVFKKDNLRKFPKGNHLSNDLKLFKDVVYNSQTIKYERGKAWVQTVDGNDNISFTNLNKDDRFC